MKRFSVIILCFLVLYSGVAWALMACLDRADHVDHHAFTSSRPHRGGHLSSSAMESHDRPAARMHCPELPFEIGPMILTSTIDPILLIDSALLKDVSFSGPATVGETGHLWLRAPFRGFSSLSFLRGLSLQILHSVFLI